jgi:hypothetical protein
MKKTIITIAAIIATTACASAQQYGSETYYSNAARGLLIKTRALDAALAAYHASRVTPFLTRDQLRARQRAERVAELMLREEAMVAKLRAKAAACSKERAL